MARKPKLPGAADFFRADDGSGQADPGDQPQSKRKTPVKSRGREEGGADLSGKSRPSSQTAVPAPAFTDAPVAARFKVKPSIMQMPPPARTLPQPPTEKITFYVPSHMLQQLELCRVQLLTEHGLKVSRSQIVQAALALTAHDSALIAETLEQLAQLWDAQSSE